MNERVLFAALFTLVLAGCGGETNGTAIEAQVPMADHASHGQASGAVDDHGYGLGVVKSVSQDGRSVVIDHGPIEGIGMGAMTMKFGAQGDVDLSALTADDKVAFEVQRGRDGSYRVTRYCDAQEQGEDCLTLP